MGTPADLFPRFSRKPNTAFPHIQKVMASPPHRDGPELEAGHLRPLSEKELILAAGSPPVTSRLYQAPKENMPSARRLLLVLMVSLMAALGVASAMSTVERPRRSEDMAGRDAESAVDSVAHAVEDAAPDSLHALLHKYFPDRFKHGVWASDEEAAEAVPELAKRANSTTAPPSSTGDPSSDPTSGPSSTPGDDTTSDNPPSTTTGGSESQSPTPTETVPSTTEEAPSTSNPPSSSPGTSTGPSSSNISPSATSSSRQTFVTASRSETPSTSHGGTFVPFSVRATFGKKTKQKVLRLLVSSVSPSTGKELGLGIAMEWLWLERERAASLIYQ